MSAKRLKTEGSRRNERRPRMPVPSFSNAPHPPPLTASSSSASSTRPLEASVSSHSTSSNTETVPLQLHWSKEDLIRVETALQMHFTESASAPKPQHHHAHHHSNNRLSFKDFYALKDKLALQRSSAGARRPSMTGTTGTSSAVSDPELLLYDFLVVAMPSLYTIRQEEEDQPAASDASTTTRRFLYLEKTTTASSGTNTLRMLEFCKLLEQQQQDNNNVNVATAKKTDEILQAICLHRQETVARKRQRQVATTKDLLLLAQNDNVKTLTRPGTTIDERVRARAALSKQHHEQATAEIEAASSTSFHGGSASKHAVDRDWLLQLADALWDYAGDLKARQNRLGSPRLSSFHKNKNNNKSKFICHMTLKDVVTKLAKATTTNGGGGGGGEQSSKGEKSSKREIVKALVELHALVPEWIVIQDDVNNNSTKLSPKASVSIHYDDYSEARRKLSGQSAPVPKTTTTATMSRNGDKKKTPASSEVTPKLPALNLPFSSTTTTTTQGLFATPLDRTSSQLIKVVTAAEDDANADNNNDDDDEIFPIPKRARLQQQQTTHGSAFYHNDDNNNNNNNNNKRAAAPLHAEEDDAAASPTRKKSRKSLLRINPNLILSDADRYGGEELSIALTRFESPRGLKTLFTKMNAGERI